MSSRKATCPFELVAPTSGSRAELPEDWSMVVRSPANVLVGGAVDAFLRTAKPHVRQPVREMTPLTFVAPTFGAGTLILRDLDGLAHTQQTALLRWLETDQANTRVISTSTSPVFASVQAGTFLSALFYRLNVLHITVIPG